MNTAVLKCPACSAELAPNATACGSCSKPVPQSSARPATSGQQGWGTETRSFECDGCGAQMVFSTTQMTLRCAYCGSEKVLEQPKDAKGEALVRPDYLLPFKVDRQRSGEIFRQWVSGLWFAPGDLGQMAASGTIRGVYVPFWCFDVEASTWYSGEAGYDFNIEETYTETEPDGRVVTKTRTVTQTRWEPTHGWNHSSYDDVLVAASKGLDQALVSGIEPFQMGERVAYTPEMLSGFEAERYSIDHDTAWKEYGKPRVLEMEHEACVKTIRSRGAQHARNLRLDARFSEVGSKHLLLPVYISAYQYGGKTWRFMINGQTGQVRGERPYSGGKIFLFVLAIVAAIALVIFLVGIGRRPSPPPSGPPIRDHDVHGRPR